jgi:hypothetical protein
MGIGGIDPHGMTTNNGGTTASLIENGLSESQQEEFSALLESHEQLEKQVKLNPNPTSDLVAITGMEEEDIHYQLYDEKGVLLTRKLRANRGVFSMNNYSSGVYYVWVFKGRDYVVRKLVKL